MKKATLVIAATNLFTATATANSLTIARSTGESMTITKEGDTFYTENSEMSLKDKQYVQNLSKFIRSWFVEHMSSKLGTKVKFEKFAKAINAIEKCNTFRGLSTLLRKSFDDEKVLSHEEFQDKFFYEGKMNVRKEVAA